jgi:hypothetical protein
LPHGRAFRAAGLPAVAGILPALLTFSLASAVASHLKSEISNLKSPRLFFAAVLYLLYLLYFLPPDFLTPNPICIPLPSVVL